MYLICMSVLVIFFMVTFLLYLVKTGNSVINRIPGEATSIVSYHPKSDKNDGIYIDDVLKIRYCVYSYNQFIVPGFFCDTVYHLKDIDIKVTDVNTKQCLYHSSQIGSGSMKVHQYIPGDWTNHLTHVYDETITYMHDKVLDPLGGINPRKV